MPNRFTTTAATLLLVANAATAQTVLSGNHSVDGNLCTGPDCTNSETFTGSADIKLKSFDTRLLFEDTSTASGAPTTDWELRANDAGSGFDYFAIRNADTDTTIFRLDDGAPSNSIYVDDDGNVGLGTSLPTARLKVLTSTDSGIEIERFGLGGGSQGFEMRIDEFNDFVISDKTNGTGPFVIRNTGVANYSFDLTNTGMIFNRLQVPGFNLRYSSGDDVNALFVKGDDGNVGIGTSTPGAPLTVSSPDAFNFFRIEALGASPNTAADMTFTSGPSGSGGEYRINVVDGDGPEMRVDGAGFVTAAAGFRVGSTNLTVPDYVFEPDYALRPLAEVASFIEQNKHLPDVPSAADIAAEGLDITLMQFALLKKVEELTLYTLEQQDLIARQQGRLARQSDVISSQEQRLARLEAAMRLSLK